VTSSHATPATLSHTHIPRSRAARARGQATQAPGPFSKPGGEDAQFSLSQTSASAASASDYYFAHMTDQPLAAGGAKMPPSSGASGTSSKRSSPLKHEHGHEHGAASDLVGGLLTLTGAGAGAAGGALPPELMDETSRPPDTSAATARAIFTPVVMNQHGTHLFFSVPPIALL
jgi:hypothetical protein